MQNFQQQTFLGKIEVFRASKVLQHVSSRFSNMPLFCLKRLLKALQEYIDWLGLVLKLCEPYSSR